MGHRLERAANMIIIFIAINNEKHLESANPRRRALGILPYFLILSQIT